MKVIGIQILPTVTHDKHVETQQEGATMQTMHWAVYERMEDRTVRFHDESGTEAGAVLIARRLCQRHRVSLELYPWQRGLMDSLNT